LVTTQESSGHPHPSTHPPPAADYPPATSSTHPPSATSSTHPPPTAPCAQASGTSSRSRGRSGSTRGAGRGRRGSGRGDAPPSNVEESRASSSIPSAAGRGRRAATHVAKSDIGQNRTYGKTSSGRIYSRFTIGGNASARDGAAREE
jgi:hypothetical protein